MPKKHALLSRAQVILDELREWIPEEEGFMKTAGERLKQELIKEAEQKALLKIQERDQQI